MILHLLFKYSTGLQVQYAALHNFEDREEDFRADVVTLRRRFTSDGMQLCMPVPAAVLQPWHHVCNEAHVSVCSAYMNIWS